MIATLILGIILFVWPRLYASQEAAIEKGGGWAVLTPTWHMGAKDSWGAKMYGWFMGGKTLTGYHKTMFFLPLVFLHFPLFVPWAWGVNLFTWSHWLELLAYYFIVCPVWDFLWFVLNPGYGLKRFRPGEIRWHKKWIGPLPVDYWVAMATVAALTAGAAWLDFGALVRVAVVLGVYAVLVIYTIATADQYCRKLAAKINKYPFVPAEWSHLRSEEMALFQQCLADRDRLYETMARLSRIEGYRAAGLGDPPESPS